MDYGIDRRKVFSFFYIYCRRLLSFLAGVDGYCGALVSIP